MEETPNTIWTFFMTPDQASRVAQLESNDITSILTMSRASQKAEDILRIAQQIRDGRDPLVPDSVWSTTPKPLHIMAHSFVKDKKQYNATYGLSDEKAAELANLLRIDPGAACKEIESLVSTKIKSKGSGREVKVLLAQAPPQSASSNMTVPDGDGGAKELAAEVAKRPFVYGQYQFEPEPTGLAGQYQFRSHLGDDLFAVGQSKKLVKNAAKICRVNGRFDEVVRPHIWYWTSGSLPLRGNEIPDDVWDGKQSASAPIKPQKSNVVPSGRKEEKTSQMVAEDVD